KQLPDYMMIWPAHGAGSACGKSLGAVPMSTVGYEKQFNWALQIDDEAYFIKELLADQPEAPVYFAEMKRVNKVGPPIIKDEEIPVINDPDTLESLMKEDNKLVLDTRPGPTAQESLIKGSINIPLDGKFTNWAGWIINYDERLLLIADESNHEELAIALRSIGFDKIHAFINPIIINDIERISYETISLDNFVSSMIDDDVYVIDVRNLSEWNQGHFKEANHH